jgi:DNA-binding transcriptional regulator YdaS (Cro superfamily)
MTRTNQEIVEMATAKVGGESALARALGIKVQSVQKWKKIPADRIIAVEQATGIPREQLRPDLYRKKRR